MFGERRGEVRQEGDAGGSKRRVTAVRLFSCHCLLGHAPDTQTYFCPTLYGIQGDFFF